MKKLFVASAIVLLVASCTKKNEEITASTTTVVPSDNTTATNPPMLDSSSRSESNATTSVSTTPSPTAATASTEKHTNYTSEDGKTKFSVRYDEAHATAMVKNETTGKSYEMKSVMSADGSKYADKDGNYFWTSKEGFLFGHGETIDIRGKEIK